MPTVDPAAKAARAVPLALPIPLVEAAARILAALVGIERRGEAVFGVGHQQQLVAEGRAVTSLPKRLAFAQRLVAYIIVINHRAGQAAVAVEIVRLGRQRRGGRGAQREVGLGVAAAQAAVGAALGGDERAVAKLEWIIILGVCIFACHAYRCLAADGRAKAQVGIDAAPRAHPQLRHGLGAGRRHRRGDAQSRGR